MIGLHFGWTLYLNMILTWSIGQAVQMALPIFLSRPYETARIINKYANEEPVSLVKDEPRESATRITPDTLLGCAIMFLSLAQFPRDYKQQRLQLKRSACSFMTLNGNLFRLLKTGLCVITHTPDRK